MAYPVVESTSYGNINTLNSYTHTITLPSGITTGDVLFCWIGCCLNATDFVVHSDSSSNFKNFHFNMLYPMIDSYYFPINSVYFVVNALSSGNLLKLESRLSDTSRNVTEYIRNVKVAYVCYRLSGVLRDSYGEPVFSRGYANSGTTNNWNLDQCPDYDDSDIRDYLWLTFVTSDLNKYATSTPAFWTDLITAQGSSIIPYSTSISSCRLATNAVSQVDPTAFGAPSANWSGNTYRIYPVAGGIPEVPTPLPTSGVGVGTYIFSKDVTVYTTINDLIETDIDYMYFSDNTTPCDDNVATIIANGNWTAAWDTGTYFNADNVAGVSGSEDITITCVGENESEDVLIDTLTITCGTAEVSIIVYQNAVGLGCILA